MKVWIKINLSVGRGSYKKMLVEACLIEGAWCINIATRINAWLCIQKWLNEFFRNGIA